MTELFRVRTEERSDIPVLILEGELTSRGEAILYRTVQSVFDGPSPKIIFDFSRVQFINSGGISVLLGIISRFRSDRTILFCGLSRHMRKVLEIVGMGEFVTIVGAIDEVLP